MTYFFLSVKDVVEHYNLASEELEGIHSPVSVLLYHVCKAISEKTQETKVKKGFMLLFLAQNCVKFFFFSNYLYSQFTCL